MKLNMESQRMELQKTAAAHVRHCRYENNYDRIIKICGVAGCGKTALAAAYVQNTKFHCYFSFQGLDQKNALTAFKNTVSAWADVSSASNWAEVFRLLVPFFKKHTSKLVLDDMEHFKGCDAVLDAIAGLSGFLSDMKNLFFLPCRYAASFGEHQTFYLYPYDYTDIRKAVPTMAAPDVARVYAMTGGIGRLLADYDEKESFQTNLKRWMQPDSVYHCTMRQMVGVNFRTPASYHGILYAIAMGQHRLSEIAKAMGVPNNQCKTYLDALIAAGFVEVKEHRYTIVHPYILFWHKFLYLNTGRLVTDSAAFAEEIQTEADNFALNVCMKYLLEKLPFSLHQDAVRLQGEAFDYVIREGKKTILVKLPEQIDWRCTKTELEKLYDSVTRFSAAFYDAEICIASFHRFSNYCVEEAARLGNLHLVVG